MTTIERLNHNVRTVGLTGPLLCAAQDELAILVAEAMDFGAPRQLEPRPDEKGWSWRRVRTATECPRAPYCPAVSVDGIGGGTVKKF